MRLCLCVCVLVSGLNSIQFGMSHTPETVCQCKQHKLDGIFPRIQLSLWSTFRKILLVNLLENHPDQLDCMNEFNASEKKVARYFYPIFPRRPRGDYIVIQEKYCAISNQYTRLIGVMKGGCVLLCDFWTEKYEKKKTKWISWIVKNQHKNETENSKATTTTIKVKQKV